MWCSCHGVAMEAPGQTRSRDLNQANPWERASRAEGTAHGQAPRKSSGTCGGRPGADGHTSRGSSDTARFSSSREAWLGGPAGLHPGQTGLPGSGQMLSWAPEMGVGDRF